MSFILSYDDKQDFVSLYFELPDSFQEHEQARQGILDHIKKYQCKKVLVNFSAMNAPTCMNKEEQFAFTQNWDGKDFRSCIFAVVLPEQKVFQDDWYFMVHFVREKGVVGQPFSKLDAAIDWLCHEAT